MSYTKWTSLRDQIIDGGHVSIWVLTTAQLWSNTTTTIWVKGLLIKIDVFNILGIRSPREIV